MPSAPGRDKLEAWLASLGQRLDAAQWSRLDEYLSRVSEQNEKVNLTADSGEALYLRHAADAFAALPVLRRRLGPAPTLLDLGAGAGFIGITLKIAWPEAEITLLEASQRKFRFLNWACERLGSRGLRVMLGRAPGSLGGKTFDAVILRAVTHPEEAAKLGLRCARPEGGICLLYQTAPPKLSPDPAELVVYRLPGENDPRHLVILERARC